MCRQEAQQRFLPFTFFLMRPYLRTKVVACFSRRSWGRKAWQNPKNVCQEAKCSRDIKIGARPACTKTKAVARAQETNKNKIVIFKLRKGLNFTLNADLWFAMMTLVKILKAKKSVFCRFPKTLKTVIFILVEIQTVIFCRKRWLLRLLDISIWRTFYSMLTIDR